uniref:Phosphatidylinositol N-acetylglucosaminyltransferase subunit H conserved domain-containing protein n=1 Tax=Oryza glaberrima TaxID=4538 RepID=I1PSS3_ORYGL
MPGRQQAASETMEQERKGEVSIGMYTYNHNSDSGFDVHEIYVKRSRFRVLLSYIGMVFLLASVCQLYLSKEGLSTGSVWSIAFGILVAKCLQYKPVKKESVVIMPTFGVQLEIHFWSGRVHRRFVPIGKILKPLLNECVTPVTCYWSLALLLRDEEELRLVFQVKFICSNLLLRDQRKIQSPIELNLQKSHPPVKMLVPVWKALCKFLNSGCQTSSAVSEPNRSET